MGAWVAEGDVKFSISAKSFSPKQLLAAVFFLKVFGVAFATLVFARFTPLIDSELYIKGFYDVDQPIRTIAIQWLAVVSSRLGGTYAAHFFFALTSASGLLYYFAKGGRRWIFILALLFPSALVWTSIVGKEALFYGAFTLSLVIWARFSTRKWDATDLAFLAVAVLVCGSLRPHYGVVIVWLFVSAVFIDKLEERAWPWLLLIAVLGCAVVSVFSWEPLLLRGFGGIEPSARASRFIYFGIDQKTGIGYDAYKMLVPWGALWGIIGPMPVELLSRPVFIPFFVEGVLIFLSPALVYLYAARQNFKSKKRFKTIFWLCLVPAILALMALHAPFGLLNPGSATRWRVNFETIFYMAPLLLLYGFLDEDHLEDRSLSP